MIAVKAIRLLSVATTEKKINSGHKPNTGKYESRRPGAVDALCSDGAFVQNERVFKKTLCLHTERSKTPPKKRINLHSAKSEKSSAGLSLSPLIND
ncbi:hypothetical protein EYF80_037127 [Liparis tanakae]|uniref:Uncharacterized protein n=1 Tax=Liparis tanakae TaxID=230148 RepID=A0A4Z2GGS2_9TELE|nr:hypothetical protein EYF80_037127 [Liparis tanakae]